MADKIDILHKRSSIENKIPTADVLKYGEIALNMFDGNLFFKKTDDTIAELKRLDSRLNEIDIVNVVYNTNEDIEQIDYQSGNIVKFYYNNDDMIKVTYHGTDGFTHLYTLNFLYDNNGNFISNEWIKE